MFYLLSLALSQDFSCKNEYTVNQLGFMTKKLSVSQSQFCINFDFQRKIGRNHAVSMELQLEDNYSVVIYDIEQKDVTKLTNISNTVLILNNTKGFITFIPSSDNKQKEKSIAFKQFRLTTNYKQLLSKKKYMSLERQTLVKKDNTKKILTAIFVTYGVLAVISSIIFYIAILKYPTRVIRCGCIYYCFFNKYPGLFKKSYKYYYEKGKPQSSCQLPCPKYICSMCLCEYCSCSKKCMKRYVCKDSCCDDPCNCCSGCGGGGSECDGIILVGALIWLIFYILHVVLFPISFLLVSLGACCAGPKKEREFEAKMWKRIEKQKNGEIVSDSSDVEVHGTPVTEQPAAQPPQQMPPQPPNQNYPPPPPQQPGAPQQPPPYGYYYIPQPQNGQQPPTPQYYYPPPQNAGQNGQQPPPPQYYYMPPPNAGQNGQQPPPPPNYYIPNAQQQQAPTQAPQFAQAPPPPPPAAPANQNSENKE